MVKKKFIGLLTLTMLSVSMLSGCGVKLEVLSEQVKETIVKGDIGENDYALLYKVRVRNKGTAGKIRAIAEIYTSEGKLYREEIVRLDADEDKELAFTFTEITVLGQLLSGANGEPAIRYRFRYEEF